MLKYVKCGLLAAIAVLIAANPKLSLEAAQNGIYICMNTIIPSLFPFAIFAMALIKSGAGEPLGKLFAPLMRPLFRLPGCGAIPLVLGFLGGYPMGAQLTGVLYQNGSLTKNEAERLLAFCNNSGPLFILGTVGIGLFGNSRMGSILLYAHISAALTVGLCFRFFGERNAGEPLPKKPVVELAPPLGEVLATSVKSAAYSMVFVCSYVILFGVLLAIFEEYGILALISNLFFGFPETAQQILAKGFFEVTAGAHAAAGAALPVGQSLALAATVISWSGLSVHFQVSGVLERCHLSKTPYFIGKALCAAFAALYTRLFLWWMPPASPVFSPMLYADPARTFALSDWSKLWVGVFLFTLFFGLLLTVYRKILQNKY